MPLPDPEELAAVARRIVEASPALETEVTVDATRDSFVRFAGRGPTQSADRDRVDVAVRVRLAPEAERGCREARATCGSLAEQDTRAALARALALAEVGPTNEKLVPLGGPVAVGPTEADGATVDHGFAPKAAWVERALSACRVEEQWQASSEGAAIHGVPSGRWHVVENGIFRGYHTNREWAGAVGEAASRGTNRAEGWYHPPIIRITNLSLMPGAWTLDGLVADTEDGVLCDTVKMWSIDQRRLNFQFTTEIGWEIRSGVRGRMLRNPTYQGNTPDFWRSCDAVCDASHWQLWGVPNCGKGNPMQVAEMSHGAAPARFRGVDFVQ